MGRFLSKNKIQSFCGDVLPLRLLSDGEELGNAPIQWGADSPIIGIRSFASGGEFSFTNGILLILKECGEATVWAEYQGERYCCSVTIKPLRQAADDQALQYYIGDLHCHTSTIHNPALFAARESGFQIDYLRYINDENKIDFGVISDHASTINDREFYQGFIDEESLAPMNVVCFPGAESEICVTAEDRLGVLRRLSGEIVTFNTAGYRDAYTWQDFYDSMADSPEPVGIFAHPQVLGYSTKGLWDFDFHRNATPEMLRLIRGIEMGNGGDRASNLIYEYSYSVALDAGFQVSCVCSSDAHEAPWGYHSMPGKTIIMAPEKSKEAFLDALRNNRFYACESGNLKIRLLANGKAAPCRLEECEHYHFTLETSCFREDPSTLPIQCEVISNNGETLALFKGENFSRFSFDLSSSEARYFYLRLMDSEGRKTWTPPIFTGRPAIHPEEQPLQPLDLSGASAIEARSGADAAAVINGDPYDFWQGEETKASILIDLGAEYECAALGYLPQIILRPKDKTLPWELQPLLAGLPRRYEVYAGNDPAALARCAAGNCRVFGAENIISFPAQRIRYLRFDVLSQVGSESGLPQYKDAPISIGNLAVFKPADQK